MPALGEIVRERPGWGTGRGGTRSSARLTKKEAASAANSQPGPKTAISTDPSAWGELHLAYMVSLTLKAEFSLISGSVS